MTEDIKQMVDQALGNQTAPLIKVWETPEAYKESTGKRFRLTKEEIAKHGSNPEGRQAAFIARRDSGKLEWSLDRIVTH